MKEITLPFSQARRQMNKILRRVDKGEVDTYVLTRNGKPFVAIVRVGVYRQFERNVRALEYMIKAFEIILENKPEE